MVTRPMSALAARDGPILAIWPAEIGHPYQSSAQRAARRVSSRQRTANKRSKGPTAAVAIRPLTFKLAGLVAGQDLKPTTSGSRAKRHCSIQSGFWRPRPAPARSRRNVQSSGEYHGFPVAARFPVHHLGTGIAAERSSASTMVTRSLPSGAIAWANPRKRQPNCSY